MRHIALLLLTMVPISAALANDIAIEKSSEIAENSSIEASNPPPSGFRISDASGFQLIEHGHWSPHPREAQAELSAFDGQQGIQLNTLPHPRSKGRPTNFRRAAFLPHVHAAESRFGLPSGLLDALIWAESKYDPLAISHAGAAGLGQLMPSTAKDLGVTNRFDPYANITGAARYLRQMLDRFGVIHLAVAAYNAGPGTVQKLGRIPLNGETPAYVRNVLDRWALD